MDHEAARADLTRALNAAPSGALRARAGLQVLIARGAEAVGIDAHGTTAEPALPLDAIVSAATAAPRSDARRAFAVLLVHALGIPGLLPPRGETARVVQVFLESVLLNPPRRAGYPFDGSPYDKRQALLALHATIDDHLRPLESTMPSWLHGLGTGAAGKD
jgi:hypothetical protein